VIEEDVTAEDRSSMVRPSQYQGAEEEYKMEMFKQDSQEPVRINNTPGAKSSFVRQLSDELFEDEKEDESPAEVQTPHPLEEEKEQIDRSQFEGMLSDLSSKSERTLYLSESKVLRKDNPIAPANHQRFKSSVFDGKLLVMKEKQQRNVKVYHICDNSDVSQVKRIEEEERARVSYLNSQDGSEPKQGHHRRVSSLSSCRPSAKYFGSEKEYVGTALRPSIVNFSKKKKDHSHQTHFKN